MKAIFLEKVQIAGCIHVYILVAVNGVPDVVTYLFLTNYVYEYGLKVSIKI